MASHSRTPRAIPRRGAQPARPASESSRPARLFYREGIRAVGVDTLIAAPAWPR